MNQLNQLLKQITFLQDAVLQDALLALGLIAAMVLVLSARREFRRETRKREKALAALTAKVATLPRGVRQQAAPTATAPASLDANGANPDAANPGAKGETATRVLPAVRSGINLNWRVQALRLLRRGQDVAHVSTALGVSRREIELLIRVHQLASGRAPSRFV